jgi:hypothetical protein
LDSLFLTLPTPSLTVTGVFRQITANPVDLFLKQWNWKSAMFSSSIRASIFFFANLTAGLSAARGAMLAEFAYRAIFAGFYGSLTQAFRRAQPAWKANLVAMVALPAISHGLEFVVHALRGTPNLKASIISSVCFTAISTLFNLYAMRRGALVVGEGEQSVWSDLRRTPRLIAGFLLSGPRWALGKFGGSNKIYAAPPLEEEPRSSELLLTPNVADQR